MKRLIPVLLLSLALVPLLAACATADRYTLGGAGIGAVAGAAAGAVIGVVTGNPAKGAAIGAVAGATIGGFKGYARGAEVEQQQAAAAAAAAAAAPQEACQWYYDHTGRYQWSCQGAERRYRPAGPPVAPLPPAERQIPMGAPAASAPPAPPAPPAAAPPAPQTWLGKTNGVRGGF